MSPAGAVGSLGAWTLGAVRDLGRFSVFSAAVANAGRRPPFRLRRLVAEIYDTGVLSLLIVCVSGFAVGMVLALQGHNTLARFGADGQLGAVVGLALIRELGPVLTSLLVAGRAGSAMAAEIGSMTVYDEISALRTMDIDPVRFLAMPRVVAGTLALPMLILYSDFIGVWGGAAVVAVDPVIKLTVNEYFARMLEWVHLSDVIVGLVKGVVFGAIASVVPCTFGFRTRGGTEGIAASTTAAVVWSFMLILLFDFIIVRLNFALV
jgi:phospholipid/cholesterol/gamma-HCH transport system permease protein